MVGFNPEKNDEGLLFGGKVDDDDEYWNLWRIVIHVVRLRTCFVVFILMIAVCLRKAMKWK